MARPLTFIKFVFLIPMMSAVASTSDGFTDTRGVKYSVVGVTVISPGPFEPWAGKAGEAGQIVQILKSGQ